MSILEKFDELLRKYGFIKRDLEWKEFFVSVIGAFLGMSLVTLLTFKGGYSLLAPSFGASCVLLFASPSSPVSQPKNVIMGHFNSACVGVLCGMLLGNGWFAVTSAVTIAIGVMFATDTLHPPGGATALVAALTGAGIAFIFTPILFGAILLTITAIFTNRLSSKRQYPVAEINLRNIIPFSVDRSDLDLD